MRLTHRTRWQTLLTACTGVALLAGTLAACGTGGTSGPTGPAGAAKGCTKVGFLLPESDTSARWESKDHPLVVAAIQKYLPGATVDVTNANNNSDTQVSQAEADLTKGDCILVVAPQDSQKASVIVEKAAAQHVPVIAYDRLIQDKNLQYYVSFDNVQVGKLQGQYVADHYQSFVSPGHTNLVMIDGSQTDNNAVLFHNGAHSVIDGLVSAGNLKLVYETYTPDWNNDTAQSEMEGALTKYNNDIQVAYVANDGMAGTVIAALKAQHLNGKVLVTGQDATVAGIQNILLGNQSMTVYKAINLEADATGQLVGALSKGSDTSSLIKGATTATSDGGNIPSVLETPVAVDKNNIATTVLQDGFVTKSDICQGVPAGTDNIC